MATLPVNGTRDLINAIARLGAITVIALYLVYQVTEKQGAQLSRIDEQMAAASVIMTTVTAQELAEIKANHEILVSLIQINKQICLNTARTDEQRQGCIK
jgi:outer membrane protease